MLPCFRRAKDRSRGADDFHGVGGPQNVSDIHERHPLCEAFIVSAAAIGVPVNPDYKGASQEGGAYYQRNIHCAHRQSAATADPRDPTVIQPNYLTALEDCRALSDGLRWRRRLIPSDALADVRGPETFPGPAMASDD